jgi:hypothetical protein
VPPDSPLSVLVNAPVPVPSEVWDPKNVGLADMPQQTPRSVIESPPSKDTLPPETTPDAIISDTANVVTVGIVALLGVVKLKSLP